MSVGSPELERWIRETFFPIDQTDVNGLADALAAATVGTAEKFPASVDVTSPELEDEPIPGCDFVAPATMVALAIGVLDAEGGTTLGKCKINGGEQGGLIIHTGAARETVSQNWPLSLSKDDVVTLEVTGGGLIRAGHSGLTIVRVS